MVKPRGTQSMPSSQELNLFAEHRFALLMSPVRPFVRMESEVCSTFALRELWLRRAVTSAELRSWERSTSKTLHNFWRTEKTLKLTIKVDQVKKNV